MITDDLRQLADRASQVDDRPDQRLAEVHGRIRTVKRRRKLAGLTGVAVVAAVLVVGGLRLTSTDQRSTGPIDKPSRTSTPTTPPARPAHTIRPPKGTKELTLRQTVLSYNARLITAVASFDDPDVRVALWETECLVCPPPWGGQGHQTFQAMAITDDGFRTATYHRQPMAILSSISSVGRDTFLLNDQGNGVQRLLRADGSLRRVRLVDETRAPKDPRLVLPCGGFVDSLGDGWCVLTVASATTARLPATYIGNGDSAARPTLGQRPWGMESLPNLFDRAWWDNGGLRRYGDLPTTGSVQPVPSLSRGDDEPTYIHWPLWSHRLEVFVVHDRAESVTKVGSRPWVPVTRHEVGEVGHPKEVALRVQYARTTEGALLAWSYRELTERPGLTIWRADSLTRGRFETVFDAPRQPMGLDLTLRNGRIHLGTLVSDDDGRTWSEPITTWR